MPPPSSLFLPLPRFPLLFLCSLFFISPLESGQGSSLFSFFHYSRSSFNKRHTHRDAYCTLSALGSPAASSHAETHKFYLTHGRTPFASLLVISVCPRPPATPSDTLSKQACFHSAARRLMVQSGPGSYLDRPQGGSD